MHFLAAAVGPLPFWMLLSGCATIPNMFRETGPSTTMEWQSPTEKDVMAHYQPAPELQRGWPMTAVAAESGAVIHGPLYFEDPFVDKGGASPYVWGWEDFVAMPYGFSRFTLNWVGLPISMIVTPPWKRMESDGVLSKQALGYDHDATRAQEQAPQPPPATQP